MAESPKKAEQKIIDKAMKNLKKAVDADEHNRSSAIDDLNFANGEQWSSEEKKRRSDKGRPALTLNFLPKFIDQVVGDMLHNTPSIKLKPIDSKSDVNIAKIRQGIINSVEYLSNSKGIYGYAAKQMVTCGYGGWRILTRYTEENPFLQEMYLEGIRNPFLIYMDPSSKDQNYADAKWGLLLEKMPKEEFEDMYPKATLPSDGMKVGQGLANELWYDGDNVTVAEYFVKTQEKVNMVQLEDGRVMSEEEYKEIKKEWKEDFKEFLAGVEEEFTQPFQPIQEPSAGATVDGSMPPPIVTNPEAPAAPPMPQLLPQEPDKEDLEPKIAKRKSTEVTVIKHYIMTCCEILSGGTEGKKFPGKFIPLVLLKGKELNIEGKNYVYSLIRNAKDPQKLINYWNTAAAETIALAPKAPWVATPKQIEGHESAYASANVENFPVLLYNVDPEAPGAPQRQGAGQPPTAIFEQIRRGEDNLKSVIGMFNADVGGPTSQQTGVAMAAAQRPGDIATFEFSENLARAVLYTGRVMNEMIPEVYDTERDVRIRNLDETETFVPVNTTVGDAMKTVINEPERFNGIDQSKLRDMFAKDGKDAKYNDITVGKYDVVVTTGPSYATQRQESAQHLLQLVQSMPQQMGIAADLLVESMDFANADELAARLRKGLPPGLAKPREGEAPPAPPQGPTPEALLAQAKMEIEKGKLELQKLKVVQEKVKLEHEKVKMRLEIAKLQAEGQVDDIEKLTRAAENKARLALDAKRISLEEQRLNHDQNKSAADFVLKMQGGQ